MRKKTNEKLGISLIVLMVTIIVTIILATVSVISINGAIDNSLMSAFATDLSTIEDLSKTYYMQNGAFPTETEGEDALSEQKVLDIVGIDKKDAFSDELRSNQDYADNTDLGAFYIIDLSKLDLSSSKRGIKKDGDNQDVYVISASTMNVYYLKGVKVKNTYYFGLTSKLVSKYNINNHTSYSSAGNTSVQSVGGLTVKKLTKNWTNVMGIYVQTNLESGQILKLKPTGVDEKTLVTTTGNNEFSFNDLSEVNGFTEAESTTFKSQAQADKKLIFTKYGSDGSVIAKIEVDMSNYETQEPTFSIDTSKIIYQDDYNMTPFNVKDLVSGIKEVRYEYLTKYDYEGNVVPYYSGVINYDDTYLRSRGKKAVPDSDGNVTLKIDKDVQGIQVLVIDKAGNTNTTKITVGFYENRDIYIGLNLKENINNYLSYGLIFVNNYGISNVSISTSSNGVDYGNLKTVTINTTSTQKIKVLNDELKNLGDISYLKVVATDNATDTKTTSTRVFKIDKKDTVGIGTIVPENTTFNLKSVSTYYNPMIPEGFAPINPEGSGTWGTNDGYTKGLVITDGVDEFGNSTGNEFVWIPVDGKDVKYEKDFTFPNGNYTATAENTIDSTLPSDITDENYDVQKYGGFYIARYEAGIPDNQTLIDGKSDATSNVLGIPTSKKGKASWANINYSNSKTNSESMYQTSTSVKSGLLTGKAWDTTCNWLKSTGVNILDSRSYGNYPNSVTPANVTGYGLLQVTGFSDNWRKNSIYDLAGNVWEWTNEKSGNQVVSRGGDFNSSGNLYPVSNRYIFAPDTTATEQGFRVRLYIL